MWLNKWYGYNQRSKWMMMDHISFQVLLNSSTLKGINTIQTNLYRYVGVGIQGINRFVMEHTKRLILTVVPVLTIYNISCQVRSEEHTSELQSRFDLVCRLLLEKKKHTEE